MRGQPIGCAVAGSEHLHCAGLEVPDPDHRLRPAQPMAQDAAARGEPAPGPGSKATAFTMLLNPGSRSAADRRADEPQPRHRPRRQQVASRRGFDQIGVAPRSGCVAALGDRAVPTASGHRLTVCAIGSASGDPSACRDRWPDHAELSRLAQDVRVAPRSGHSDSVRLSWTAIHEPPGSIATPTGSSGRHRLERPSSTGAAEILHVDRLVVQSGGQPTVVGSDRGTPSGVDLQARRAAVPVEAARRSRATTTRQRAGLAAMCRSECRRD